MLIKTERDTLKKASPPRASLRIPLASVKVSCNMVLVRLTIFVNLVMDRIGCYVQLFVADDLISNMAMMRSE